MTQARFCQRTVAIALLGALAACTAPGPVSPDVAAQQHQYQTGCRLQDATGYEMLKEYCGGGGGGGKE